MTKMPLTYLCSNTLMDNWQLYPLELYAFIITTPSLTAYQITGGTNITQFILPAKKDVDVEKIVQGLLFKHQDIINIENKNELDPLKKGSEDTTGARVDRKKTVSKAIIRMINAAGPEVEKLYAAIKRIGFSGRETATYKQYKEASINFFHENREEFKLVKEGYLTEGSLYTFREGHQKGDFIGKLLQKISNDLDLCFDNYQELYKIYRSTK